MPAKTKAPTATSTPKTRNRRIRIALVVVALAAGGFAIYQLYQYFRAGQHYRNAQRALDLCNFQEAGLHLDRYLDHRPTDAEALLLAAQTARRRGDFEAADKLLKRAVECGVDKEALNVERLLMRVHAGNVASAERLLILCKDKPGSSEGGIALEAVIEGSMRAMELPLSIWGISLWLNHRTSDLDQARGLVWRGQLEALLGEAAQATADFHRAVELAPDLVAAHMHLGEVLAREDPQAAGVEIEWLNRHAADEPTTHVLTARWRRALGQPEEAIRILDNLLQAEPKNLQALIDRGRVAMDLGKAADAEGWIKQALKLAPGQRDATLAMADCLRQAGRLKEAEVYTEKAQAIKNQLEAKLELLQKKKDAELTGKK